MRGRFQFALVLGLVLMGSRWAHAGEVIDGIVATVNGVAILQSDVDEAVRCEALMEGHPPVAVSAAQREAVLQRLIDQELLRQQMADAIPAAKPAELAARIRQLKCSLGIGGGKAGTPAGGPCEGELPVSGQGAGVASAGDQAWRNLLASYDLTEEELAESLSGQMQLTAFIESRLDPSVRVDAASVQAYYQDKFLPELHHRGVQKDPPLAQVSSQIEEVLRQQHVDQMLNNWLQTLRQQSRIRIGPESPLPAAGSAGPPGDGGTAGPKR